LDEPIVDKQKGKSVWKHEIVGQQCLLSVFLGRFAGKQGVIPIRKGDEGASGKS